MVPAHSIASYCDIQHTQVLLECVHIDPNSSVVVEYGSSSKYASVSMKVEI